MAEQRDNRFGGNLYAEHNVQSGYEEASGYRNGVPLTSGINRAYVKRNLRGYAKKSKPIRRAIKTNFRSLKGKNYAQLERIATMAVIKDAGVKRRKLRTKINRGKFKARHIAAARRKLQRGYGIRKLGQTGKSVQDIKSTKVRAATRHLANVRKNRAITKTPLAKGKGYDIRAGHTSLSEARKANYWRSQPRRRRRK